MGLQSLSARVDSAESFQQDSNSTIIWNNYTSHVFLTWSLGP